MGKIIKLIITIDIDNDFVSIPLENAKTLQWEGLAVGLPKVLDVFNTTARALDIKLSITIFCRADWQIEKIMGHVGWVFFETKKIIACENHEHLSIDLQWHPHLYQEVAGYWAQSHDEFIQQKQLRDVHKKLNQAGIKITCSRIGECFFNNNILNTLSELQIKCDSSAFSGRNIGHTNWEKAPTHPYHPGKNNFTQEGELSMVEAPFAMIPIHAPYETSPSLRYLNLIYATEYTSQGIKHYSEEVLVTIIHPYELLTLNKPSTHKLFGSIDAISKNLEMIFSILKPESIFLEELI